MTNPKQRIEKLLTDIGINLEKGGYSSAEIAGYCAGIKMIADKVDKIIKYIFINLEDNDDISYYKAFVKSAYYKDEIINRLGEKYGYYGANDFFQSLAQFGGCSIDIMEGIVTFDHIHERYYHLLGAIAVGKIPSNLKVQYAGPGKTFDEWDNWEKSWIELDKMGLPFNIIDTLRGDKNE